MFLLKEIHTRLVLISNKTDLATQWVCTGLMILLSIEVLGAVFFRYALGSPLRWGEEVARLTMVWMGLLAIGIALKSDEHIGLEFVTSKLHGRLKACCKLAFHSLVIPFLIVLLIWGIRISQESWTSFTPALQIQWTWFQLSVPLTAVIQLIHICPKALAELMVVIEGERSQT